MAAVFYFPLIGTPTAEGNQLWFYVAGTSTPLDVWTDSDLTIPWAQPIILNAAGESTGPIYVSPSPSYKVRYEDANGVAIAGYPVDFVSPSTILNVTKTVIKSFTDAQIKALPTASQTLVAAPGSGLWNHVLTVSYHLKNSSGAYTNINTTYSTLTVNSATPSGWLVVPIANDSTLSTPLARLTDFAGVAHDVVVVAPEYVESIQTTATTGKPEWTVPQTTLGTHATALDNVATILQWDNNGSGNLTGGNAANTLTVTVYYAIESLA